MLAKLTYAVAKTPDAATPRDWFLAVTFATRDIIVVRWLDSPNAVYVDGRKRVSIFARIPDRAAVVRRA